MDPNANLEEQRRIRARLLTDEHLSPGDIERAATRLAELSEALDEWLRRGGALPRTWCGSAAVDRRGRKG